MSIIDDWSEKIQSEKEKLSELRDHLDSARRATLNAFVVASNIEGLGDTNKEIAIQYADMTVCVELIEERLG